MRPVPPEPSSRPGAATARGPCVANHRLPAFARIAKHAAMLSPALVMACVAGAFALVAAVILARPARSEQGIYIRRIAAMMTIAAALILALFAWGLTRIAG